jgi:tetratricopeptide (TPR) repeat protein
MGALAQYKVTDLITRQLYERDPTNTDWMRSRSVTLNKLGDVELATKDFPAAIASYRAALAIREQLVAKDPKRTDWRRDLFFSHYKIARAFNEASKDVEAVAETRAALAIADATYDANPKNETFASDTGELHRAIAYAIEKTDPAGAQRDFRRASEIAHAMAAMPNTDPKWPKRVKELDAKIH